MTYLPDTLSLLAMPYSAQRVLFCYCLIKATSSTADIINRLRYSVTIIPPGFRVAATKFPRPQFCPTFVPLSGTN
jgi:hypothetical protein